MTDERLKAMNHDTDLDRLRGDVLARIESARRRFLLAFFAAAGVEALMLAIVLFLIDFHDRTHVLVFVTSMMVYTVLCAGLVALGAYARLLSERTLKAIALVAERAEA
jgi:hypothetical protein